MIFNNKRNILKNGDCNIFQTKITKHRLQLLKDVFTTLVATQWRWNLVVFTLSFLLSWLAFACIWWFIMYNHGDLIPEHLPPHQTTIGWDPCVSAIYGFTSCFSFSIEVQHTMGKENRICTEAIVLATYFLGVVCAKMTRPKKRNHTLLFSRNAVVCLRDGFLCLMFRVGDMREKSRIIGANIRAELIRTKTTLEGEVLTQDQTELVVNADRCADGDLVVWWPMIIVHRIDEESPLYHLSAADMLQDRFEIVAILEGTIESTGQTTQARSSYLASEVLWGHRLEPLVSYNHEKNKYSVNYSKFDITLPVDTPRCSGAQLNVLGR